MSEDEDRFYPNPENPDEMWPSVTTILGATVSKPRLPGWYGRESADYAIDHHDAIGQMLAAGTPDADIRALIATAGDRTRDTAGDLGKAFHAVAEARVKGEAISLPEDMAGRVAPFLATFERMLVELDPVFEWSEATVYNPRHDYAGTCDAGWRLKCRGGRLDLNDWKTGRSPYWPESILQLAGYGICTRIGLRDGLGTIAAMPEVDGHTITHIRPDGYRVIPVEVTPARQAAFLHARRLFAEVRDTTGWGLPVWADGPHVDDVTAIDVRARNRLMLAGVRTLAELAALGPEGLLAVPYAGVKTVEKVTALFEREGLTWATTTTEGAAA